MTNFIKKLFHKHDLVIVSRKHINTYKAPICKELETFNTYLYKAYCIKCKQKIIFKQSIIAHLDITQPYDN